MMTPPKEPLREPDKYVGQKPPVFLKHKQNDQNQLWLWFLVLFGALALLWTGGSKLLPQSTSKQQDRGPFFQVTNRQMSLFLWQNPNYMRMHRRFEKGYLPGFYAARKVSPKIELVDELVVAPKEVLFLYHTWKRLLSEYVMPRAIPMSEFLKFLNYAEEWLPKNWPDCPQGYKEWIEGMQTLESDSLQAFQMENLQALSPKELPNVVRQAFIGWKNTFRESDIIDDLEITVAEMRAFLEKYPNYSRNYWRNIYPKYLKSLQQTNVSANSKIPKEELIPFLKIAFFNYQQSQ